MYQPVDGIGRGAGARSAPAAGARSAPGLDYSKQGPGKGDVVVIDPRATRYKRMKLSTITAARLLGQSVLRGGFRGRWAFVTLTYAEAGGWNPAHIRGFMRRVRDWFRERGERSRYVWVAEIQTERFRASGEAAVHYHCLIWVRRGLTLPKPDRRGWWAHGSTNIQAARNAVGYIAKYASKGDLDAKLPKGLRLHGCGGLEGAERAEWRWWKLPRYVRDAGLMASVLDVPRRVRSGWVFPETGIFLQSPWVFGGLDPISRFPMFVRREEG